MILMILMSLICLIGDWFMHYYLPYSFGNLSVFTSMLTIVSILILRVYFHDKKISFIWYCLGLGFIYDVFFSSILLWNTIVFLSIGLILLKFDIKILKKVKWCLLITTSIILYYDLIWFLTGMISDYSLVFTDYLYKVINSLVLNLIFTSTIILMFFKNKKYQ